MKQYDIFISYRRSSYDTANLIATRLKSAGYTVFFDMETLRSNKFNVQLYEAIDNCKDFIVVLPPNALDRCVDEEDWVRLEVCRAMDCNKNIIPVMLNGFEWPSVMPDGMEELRNYQALTANSIEYFDLSMERLQNRYLTSKRRLPIFKILKYSGICIASLLIVVSILWGVFMTLSKDVCQKYATLIAWDASCVHMIAEENHRLVDNWKIFDNAMNYESNSGRIAILQQEMEARIDLVESNLSKIWTVNPNKMEITPYHSFLLTLHGINAEEMAMSPEVSTLYYNDYLNQLNTIRQAVREPNTINRRFSSTLLEVFEHSLNAYYATVLLNLSSFPKKTVVVYEELSKNWIHFPVHLYKFGEDREYYESIVNTENQLASEYLSRFESVLEQKDAELEDIEQRGVKLENLIQERTSDMFNVIDSASVILMANAEIERIKKENETELALQREKVETKRIALEASKAELEGLEKQYVQAYESLKEKCTITEEDDQWYKWGKICRWGSYLSMLVESRQELLSQGVYSTSSITPEVAYANLNSMLTVYQMYHPESTDYVVSAKQFFKEVSNAKRDYAGVIIFAFKDNAEHPFFKRGDIVVDYNGNKIKNYEDFSVAYKSNKEGVVKFIRCNDAGRFDEIEEKIVNTDIIGFLELTE